MARYIHNLHCLATVALAKFYCLAILYGLSLYVYVVVVHAWSFATDEDYCMVVETFGS